MSPVPSTSALPHRTLPVIRRGKYSGVPSPPAPATTYVGGIRARLVFDSVFNWLVDALGDLQWFDTGRQHAPVTFVAEAQDVSTEIPLNTLALSDEPRYSTDAELGSAFAEKTWTLYVDFFAESTAIGKQLINDVADILEGRMPSIGANAPVIPVYDWTMPNPPLIFAVDIESVRIDRAHNYPHPYLRNWYSCQFQVIDYYGDENDASATWAQASAFSWGTESQRIWGNP